MKQTLLQMIQSVASVILAQFGRMFENLYEIVFF